MTCYIISHGNESIAFVSSLGMVRAITRCQPPGHYRVCEIEVDLAIVERQSPGRRQGIRHPVSHRGHNLAKIGSEDLLPPSGCATTACAFAPEQATASRECSEDIPTPDLSIRASPMPISGLSLWNP